VGGGESVDAGHGSDRRGCEGCGMGGGGNNIGEKEIKNERNEEEKVKQNGK
jgi:hypothetical protein